MLIRVAIIFVFSFALTDCITVENTGYVIISNDSNSSSDSLDILELSPDSSGPSPPIETQEDEEILLSFQISEGTIFECGEPAGVHLVSENENGQHNMCNNDFATDTGIADCIFYEGSGNWRVTEMWVYDTDGEPMDCCTVEYPNTYITAEQAIDLNLRIVCELPEGRALDIAGLISVDVTSTCGTPAGMHVAAENEYGDRDVCDEDWISGIFVSSPETGEGDYLIADCFVFMGFGNWRVTEIWIYDTNGERMGCCDAEYPEITLTSELVSEYYLIFDCD